MSQDQYDTNGSTPSGSEDQRWTRRHALKAGVGVGVAAAAWTGPSITSVGAAPGYAAGCTFAREVVLADDRNTDQSEGCVSQGGFGYHPTDLTNLPAGYTILNLEDPPGPGWNSQVCSTVSDPYDLQLIYPKSDNLNCAIVVEFFLPAGPKPRPAMFTFDFQDSSPDSYNDTHYVLNWHLPTAQDVLTETGGVPVDSSTRYRVILRCVTPGLEWCFDPV